MAESNDDGIGLLDALVLLDLIHRASGEMDYIVANGRPVNTKARSRAGRLPTF
jgi:hypothetical protein